MSENNTLAPDCGYDTGSAGSGPLTCGHTALFVWSDPDHGERLVCGRHAKSVRAKFLPGGGSLTPINPAPPAGRSPQP